MNPVNRSSARLSLRELGANDVDAVLAIYGSPEATEHLSFEPRTRDQVGQIVARSMTATTEEPRTEYALAVIELMRRPGMMDSFLDQTAKTAAQYGLVHQLRSIEGIKAMDEGPTGPRQR